MPAVSPKLAGQLKALTRHIEKIVTLVLLVGLVGLVAYKFLFPPSVPGTSSSGSMAVRRMGIGSSIDKRIKEAAERAEALRAVVSPKPPTYYEELAKRNPFEEIRRQVEPVQPRPGDESQKPPDTPPTVVVGQRTWIYTGRVKVGDSLYFFLEFDNGGDVTTYPALKEGQESKDGRVVVLRAVDENTVQIRDMRTGRVYELKKGIPVSVGGLSPAPSPVASGGQPGGEGE